MNYWRMQLHPDDSGKSGGHSFRSLSAGYIGLDFREEIGDLNRVKYEDVPDNQKDYLAFHSDMAIDDKVLIIVHHFPFAVVTISGEYNYILNPEPELGVWFRHFRKVEDVRLYSDFKTNAKGWEPITMTDTISILRSPDSLSYGLIKEMTE